MTYRPARHHAELGPAFADEVSPASFPRRDLRFRNDRWAAHVGLDHLEGKAWERHFACFEPLPENLPAPLALRYHGHQFDHYNPELGDGRGFLFAQLYDDAGRLLDLGTKGSGTTPYSRGGDGRLTLKGGVREVLATEMLEALGVYTSKTFSLFETGESLVRGDEPSPTRSSVLVRLSHSHVRIGTFQRLAFEGDADSVAELVEYCFDHLFPGVSSNEGRPAALLREVSRRSADLCASWMVAGFVHGVLNSDNMVVTGESFDYGPWRFLPSYDPQFTAAYFDHAGLYAFARQPRAVFKNVCRLGNALGLIEKEAPLVSAVTAFMTDFETARVRRTVGRLGVRSLGYDEDQRLVVALLDTLARTQIPFDQFFFDWYGGGASAARASQSPLAPVYADRGFESLRQLLLVREPLVPERLALPYFDDNEPTTLVIDEVERIWGAIAESDDWGPFEAKIAAIRVMGDATGCGYPASTRFTRD